MMQVEKSDVNGIKVFTPKDQPRQASYCFPDKQTMLMGMRQGMEHVLASEKTMSGLIDRLKESDANATDIFVTFQQNGTSQKFVEFISGQLEGFPFDVADIATEAIYGDMNIRFADGKPIQASIKAKDADGAAPAGSGCCSGTWQNVLANRKRSNRGS